MIRSLTAAAVAALALGPLAPALAQTAPSPEPAGPVKILACYVTPQVGGRLAEGTTITFVNTGATTLHSISFDVRYHTIENDLIRTFDDSGTFSPGARITHAYDAYRGVSWTGGLTNSCTVTDAH
jgi:hypothetical protein